MQWLPSSLNYAHSLNSVYHSNGKLLLTGEYVVLDGAKALAVPTRFGQSLEVLPKDDPGIEWNSLDQVGNRWFHELFDRDFLPRIKSNDVQSKTLSTILQEAAKLNPMSKIRDHGWQVNTQLEFDRDWGLGTSSTLINNIAQWFEVDAFRLLQESFGGSGYDIAAAQNDQPLLYTQNAGKPLVELVSPDWKFKDQLFFVHLNRKQDSKEGIERYRKRATTQNTAAIERISIISEEVLRGGTIDPFISLLTEHEEIIASLIGLTPIKQELFSSFDGLIKSLGAWGGDFILASGNRDYFKMKGYHTILEYDEMVKF
ncbi:MAG: GHMP kinase [Flavobacteriaceae bacterium]|nr:GHMP kinase [Flavobacteriaceae bacterium]